MEPLRLKVNDEIELIQLRPEDAEIAFALIEKNRKFLRDWLPWVDKTKTVADEKFFIEKIATKDGGMSLGIWHKETFIGAIGLHAINEQDKKTSIGYWLSQDANGKGIMTSCVKRLLAYCFEDLKLNRVAIYHAVGNEKSKAVIERCGFKQEGIIRQFENVNGKFLDNVCYSMLASEFNKNV